jgi:hypothetical protein
MKIEIKSITSLGALASICLLGASHAFAATTSSKDGVMTTTESGIQTRNRYDNELPMLATGVQELGLSGRLNWEDDTAYNFDISYGRFFSPNWLLGVEAGISGINSDKDYRAGLFAEYNFLTNTKWVPFIRATASYEHPNAGESGGLLDLDGGVKYFFRSNLAISASIGGGWNTSGDSEFQKQVNLGLKFYFD